MTPSSTLSLRAALATLDHSYPRQPPSATPPATLLTSTDPPLTSVIKLVPSPPAKPKPKVKRREKPRRKSRTSSVSNDGRTTTEESIKDLKPGDAVKTRTSAQKSSTNKVKLPTLKANSPDSDNPASGFKKPTPPVDKSSSAKSSSSNKKPRRPAILHCIRPENAEEEKEKFFRSEFQYNPQLTYKTPATEAALDRFSRPAGRLLPLAEKILNRVIHQYQTYERFIQQTAGRRLSRFESLESARDYLKQEGLTQEVSVRISEDMLARACMSRVRGQPTLQLRANSIRQGWMDGILRHEIGTHYIRSSNNRLQPWSRGKTRRSMDLGPVNPTEEGLAALNSVVYRAQPSLFRSALLYYTVYYAARLSFVELFELLGQFVADAELRWDYCMRAKRGQSDTQKPGGFCKDQVYLHGALTILKHRHTLDFHALVKCGKVDYRDVDRLKESADLDNSRVPSYMADQELYRTGLGDIATWNGLTDEDLAIV